MKKVGLSIDELFVKHDNGLDHPESPDRLYAINDMLHQTKLIDNLTILRPRDASKEEIVSIHDEMYFERIKSTRGKERVHLDQDTSTNAFSYDAALRASGAVLEGLDNIISKKIDIAFPLVRPPGHHAEKNKAMGFCLFNHISVGASYLLDKGFDKVLIIDFDVHHGNGTQHIFENTKDVLYFSTHQFPFYPGTGSLDEVGIGDGEGYTVNIPLPSGMGDNDYLSIYSEILIPITNQFRPDFILVSAGFDSHIEDPLSGMNLSTQAFSKITRLLIDLADNNCNEKILFLLEGGYDLNALWETTHEVFQELLGLKKSSYEHISENDNTKYLINEVKSRYNKYWNFS